MYLLLGNFHKVIEKVKQFTSVSSLSLCTCAAYLVSIKWKDWLVEARNCIFITDCMLIDHTRIAHE